VRGNRRAAAGTLHDAEQEAEDRSADQAMRRWQEDQRSLDPEIESRLGECLLRLPGPYRTVVLMHHFEAGERTLQSLTAVLGATVDAIHKRYQRAIAMLRDCLQTKRELHVP
jgi:DNA-directed RNA polymerase specialized sigma24 family protein